MRTARRLKTGRQDVFGLTQINALLFCNRSSAERLRSALGAGLWRRQSQLRSRADETELRQALPLHPQQRKESLHRKIFRFRAICRSNSPLHCGTKWARGCSGTDKTRKPTRYRDPLARRRFFLDRSIGMAEQGAVSVEGFVHDRPPAADRSPRKFAVIREVARHPAIRRLLTTTHVHVENSEGLASASHGRGRTVTRVVVAEHQCVHLSSEKAGNCL
jgi:hypothetical protein